MSDEAVERILTQLRQAGGRVTPARRALVTALVDDAGHVTAEQLAATVQARQPDVHQSTVYRILDDLERLGVVEHAHLGHGAAVYHLAADLHHHLVCEQCGAVIEIPNTEFAALGRRMREAHGFLIRPQHFAILGRCRDCAAG